MNLNAYVFSKAHIFMKGSAMSRQTTVTWLMMSRQALSQLSIKVHACVILKREEVSARADSHSCDHHQPDRTGHMAAETFRSVSATSSLAAHFCCCSIDQWVAYVLELPDQYDAVRFSLKKRSLYFDFTLQDLIEMHLNGRYIPCHYPVWKCMSDPESAVKARGNVKACIVLYHCKP